MDRRGRRREKRHVFGVPTDVTTQPMAIRDIVGAARSRRGVLVFTPNMDHVLRHRSSEAYRDAYAKASFHFADGWPLVAASRISGTQLPERVTGSDLVMPLCEAAEEAELSIFILGSQPEVLDRCEERLGEEFPRLKIAGTHSPPFGLLDDLPGSLAAVDAVNLARPDILFLALSGGPQELWAARWADELDAGVIVGVGASFDFIAGHQTRAPLWVRRIGAEWFWRAGTNPKRLLPRYARIVALSPSLLVRELRERVREQRRSESSPA